MHFGKIVKNVCYAAEISANDFAQLMGLTEVEVLNLFEEKDWKSSDLKLASIALEHDFGKYFSNGFQFDFMSASKHAEFREMYITVKYPKGKEFLLKTWLDKMAAIAKVIGLQMNK